MTNNRKDNKILQKGFYSIFIIIVTFLFSIILKNNAKIKILESVIVKLKAQLDKLKKDKFGSTSEKKEKLKSNDDDSSDDNSNSLDALKSVKTKKRKNNKSNGWRNNPNLSVETTYIDINDKDKFCKCCDNPLTIIGENVTKKLGKIIKFYIKKIVRPKYACNHCEQNKVITSPLPAQIIDKSYANSDLLASIVSDLYFLSLPVYRIQKSFKTYDISISDSTIHGWLFELAFIVKPIVEQIKQDMIMFSHKLHTDDTTIKIIKSDKKGKCHTGRFWVYVADNQMPIPLTFIEYTSTREGKHPAKVLKEFSGYLQADAYSGYDALYQTKANPSSNIIEVACLAHVRRKFYDIAINEPAGSIANIIICKIAKLYKIESEISNKDTLYKYAYRKRYAKPQLKDLFKYLNDLKIDNGFLPKSNLGKAISYALKNRIALQRYLSKSYLSIDNNLAERAIKDIVIGRKNFLFKANHKTAENAAIFYSLIATCKQNDVNPVEYFTDIFERLPTMLAKNVGSLTPYNWKAKKHPDKALKVPISMKLSFRCAFYEQIYKLLKSSCPIGTI